MTLFAEDYFEARAKFRAAVSGAKLDLESIVHPHASAPDGRELTIDVARAGAEDASRVLFTVCGTHGVEGYPGSAAQIQLLQSGHMEALPDDVAVVFLHGLNPYGWSRNSQRNEDGMDINRNFIDFSQVPEDDVEAVSQMAAVLDTKKMSFAEMVGTLQRLAGVRSRLGAERFIQRISGQYCNPRGWKFGGHAPSWSNRMYRDIVRRYLGRATHIAELDWHTGLGQFGDIVPLCFAGPDTEEYAQTAEWWGADAVAAGRKAWAPGDPNADMPRYSGLAHAGLEQELPGARIAGGVVELGTMPLDQISLVVILDHWLTFEAGPDDHIPFWRAQMRTFMAPREPLWERSVLVHADRLYSRMLNGLFEWR